jgi:hypothetical protein
MTRTTSGRKAKKARGFIFIMDVLLAAVIAAVVFDALPAFERDYNEITSNADYSTTLDLLTVAEKSGVLASLVSKSDVDATAALNSFLNSSLGWNMCASLNVSFYSYDAGGDSFALQRTLSSSKCGSTKSNSASAARRVFDAISGTNVQYALVKVKVWRK